MTDHKASPEVLDRIVIRGMNLAAGSSSHRERVLSFPRKRVAVDRRAMIVTPSSSYTTRTQGKTERVELPRAT